jgi:hypothetical protein
MECRLCGDPVNKHTGLCSSCGIITGGIHSDVVVKEEEKLEKEVSKVKKIFLKRGKKHG